MQLPRLCGTCRPLCEPVGELGVKVQRRWPAHVAVQGTLLLRDFGLDVVWLTNRLAGGDPVPSEQRGTPHHRLLCDRPPLGTDPVLWTIRAVATAAGRTIDLTATDTELFRVWQRTDPNVGRSVNHRKHERRRQLA